MKCTRCNSTLHDQTQGWHNCQKCGLAYFVQNAPVMVTHVVKKAAVFGAIKNVARAFLGIKDKKTGETA